VINFRILVTRYSKRKFILVGDLVQSRIKEAALWGPRHTFVENIPVFWDGQKLHAKEGGMLNPPPFFVEDLPIFPLEGELW
jgi:hypothetical protein